MLGREQDVRVVVQLEQKGRSVYAEVTSKGQATGRNISTMLEVFEALDNSVSHDAYILGVGGVASDPKAQ